MSNTTKKPKEIACKNGATQSASELRRMCPQEKARYLAYQEAPKDVQKALMATKQRIRSRLAATRENVSPEHATEEAERKQRAMLIGQLKATEARNRIRLMKLRYQTLRTQEINFVISCQSTAQNAIRLHLLLPVKEDRVATLNSLDKLQRKRIEELLEDELGLTLIRS